MPGMLRAERGPSPLPRLAVLVALGLLAVALVPAPQAEAARITTTPALPINILGTSAVLVGEDVYVFGGRSNSSYQATILKYSTKTGASSPLSTLLPSGRQSTSAVWTGQYAWIFGGAELVQYNDPQFGQIVVPNALDEIVRFDPASGEVKKLADLRVDDQQDRLPVGLWGTSAVWDGAEQAAYIFGGFHFNYATKVFERKDSIIKFKPGASGSVSDPRIVSLSEGASPVKLPWPIQDAGTAVVGTKAYLFGGLTTQQVNGTASAVISDAILSFDLVTERVNTLSAKLPYGTQFAPAVAAGGDVYVFGGRLRNASASGSIVKFFPAQTHAAIFELPLPSVRYAMSGATDGTTIWLLGGRDGNQNIGGLKDVVTFVPGATEPTAPRSLTGTSDGTGITLRWSPPLYDGGSPVTAYAVARVDPDQTVTNLSRVTELTYTDRSVKPGTQYVYRVTAINARGESRAAAETSVSSSLRAPSEPRSFEVFAGDGVVQLRWQAPADSGGSSAISYRVYRNNSDKPLDTIAGTRYSDDKVQNEVTYTYRVAAVGGFLEGPSTSIKSAKPSDKIPGVPTGVQVSYPASRDKIEVSWTAAERATSYEVRYGTSPADLSESVESSASTTRATITGVREGVRYFLDVRGVDGALRGPPSELKTAAFIVAPTAVANATPMAGAGYIRLQWSPPASLGGADSAFYRIVRIDSADVETTGVAADARWRGTAWTDRNVTGGESYRYRILPVVLSETGAPLEGPGVTTTPTRALLASNSPPVAALVAKPVTVERLEDVEFDASFSSDADGTVRDYFFEFGDKSGTGWVRSPSINHRYEKDGTYVATVLVKDDRGEVSLRSASVQIVVGKVLDSERNDPGRTLDEGEEGGIDPNARVRRGPEKTGFLGLPGFEVAFAALAAVGAALLLRRRA